MSLSVAESYKHCRHLTRDARSSFFYSFFMLSRAKRQAMYALYAFLRRTDDIGDCDDEIGTRRLRLDRWRESLEAALAGRFRDPIFPALADAVVRYDIPHVYLAAAIDGVQMDLEQDRYATFDELESYCYRVASVVGLACIHIWGYRDDRALAPARACGLAFQITNILRDLNEDARRGRVYLPQEDLRRFDYSESDLLGGVCDRRFAELMNFQIDRARRYYHEAAPLADYLRADGRRVFGVMLRTYRELLARIERRHGDVLAGKVSLSHWRRLAIVARCCLTSNR
jgi:phytoene synthase